MGTLTAAERRAKLWAVVRVASGNFLEMYDFMVIGYYSIELGRAFFPSDSESASLLLALMTFGAGFLMRPLGALVLGAYTDRHGRRQGLMLTLSLMSVGTLLLACTPDYQTLGVLAPLLVLCGRLLQGFSAGAELGGVSVYLAEIATPGHKGFYVSWQSASQQLAVVFAASLGFGLRCYLSDAQMTAWGWRVPLLVGCLIIPFVFLIRRSLQETDEFRNRTHHPGVAEIYRSIATHWRVVLLGSMLVVTTTVSFYLITAYTRMFGQRELGLTAAETSVLTLCVGLSNFFWLPVMGALSDRLGRRPQLLTCTVLLLLTAFPALSWLVAAPSFERFLVVGLWLSFLYAGYNGAMVVYLTEIMPGEVRTVGFALAYSLATAIFGGFTPAIVHYHIRTTGIQAFPGLWLSLAAACSFVAALLAEPYRQPSDPAMQRMNHG